MKKLIFCLAAISAVAVSAMPTKKEVTAAREVVAELMSDVVSDQKAGKLTAVQVAEKALALAGRAETEPVKLLLIQGAVMGFARGGEPARAAEAMQRMKAEIKDVTPEYEADILARAVKTVPAKSGSLLYAMLDDARRLVKFRKDIPVIEKKLERIDTLELRMELAERLAALGEWKRALEMFAKMDGDVARAAKFERGELTGMTASEVADIWWAQKGVKDYAGYTVFQRHAGEWYKKALADGSLKGLKRDLAQKRIDGMGGGDSAARSASAPYQGDATGGPRPVAATDGDAGGPRPVAANDGDVRGSGTLAASSAPQSGERPKDLVFKLDSKTDLEMVGIPAGKFTMGYEDWERGHYVSEMCKPHEVTITRHFWVAKLPVTFGMAKALRYSNAWMNMMVPKDPSALWPKAYLDDFHMWKIGMDGKKELDDLFKLLNTRVRGRPNGYVFRPPTMAEWEYYLKADGSDPGLLRKSLIDHFQSYYCDDMKAYWKRLGNPEWTGSAWYRVPVNLFKPNPWGIHYVIDVAGEWMLDTVDADRVVNVKRSKVIFYTAKGVSLPDKDPVLIAESKEFYRLARGTTFFPERIDLKELDRSYRGGVRIVLGPDLIAEQAKKK